MSCERKDRDRVVSRESKRFGAKENSNPNACRISETGLGRRNRITDLLRMSRNPKVGLVVKVGKMFKFIMVHSESNVEGDFVKILKIYSKY